MIARIVFIAKYVMIYDANRVEKKKRKKSAEKIPKTTKKIKKDFIRVRFF